jgi:hypothetical protein
MIECSESPAVLRGDVIILFFGEERIREREVFEGGKTGKIACSRSKAIPVTGRGGL